MKTNAPISLQIGTSGPRGGGVGEDMKCSTLGVSGSKVKVTGRRRKLNL